MFHVHNSGPDRFIFRQILQTLPSKAGLKNTKNMTFSFYSNIVPYRLWISVRKRGTSALTSSVKETKAGLEAIFTMSFLVILSRTYPRMSSQMNRRQGSSECFTPFQDWTKVNS